MKLQKIFKIFILSLVILNHASLLAKDIARHGKIYAIDDLAHAKEIFSYERREESDDKITIVTTQFKELSGKVNCEEIASFENGALKKYVYKQIAAGDFGEAEFREGKIFFHFRSGEKDKTDSTNLEPNTIVPDMIEPLIQKNWDLIEKEDSIKVRYVLVERLDTIGFKFFKMKDIIYEGQNAVLVRMKPSSIFIAAIAPNIELIFQKEAPHKLLETRGRLAIRVPEIPDPKTRKDWHAIDAIVKLL